MDGLIKAVRTVSQACGVVAAFLIVLGVFIVCEMVFERSVLGTNTIWQGDFTTNCLVVATFIGSPYVLMTRGHVNVDVLPLHAGPRFRFWLALVSIVIGFAFVVVLAALGYNFWHEAWVHNWRSNTIWRERLWIPYAAMPVGLILLALQYVIEFICLVTGREPPFGMRADAAPGREFQS
ncbi:MAG TPA: TRAP transporter small permease [Stellaceae bacterium]|nr:TRAP transporter small permease [Stellaceae bacterium]